MEKSTENMVNEGLESSKSKKKVSFELSTKDSGKLVKELDFVANTINHNESVTGEHIMEIGKSVEPIKFNLWGENMTIGEIENIPDIKESVKIWKEILNGDFSHVSKLAYVTDDLVIFLNEHQADLKFASLKKISEKSIEYLSSTGRFLNLGLTSLSDHAVQCLSRHEGVLELNHLKELTPVQAKYLGMRKIDLELRGLTTISADSAKYFKDFVYSLSLSGVTDLSDDAAKALGERHGFLDLSGLASITDTAAKYFGNHTGGLWLRGLRNISTIAASYLAKNRNLEAPGIIEQLEKYKK